MGVAEFVLCVLWWVKSQGVALQIKRWFGELFHGYSIKGSMWGFEDFDR